MKKIPKKPIINIGDCGRSYCGIEVENNIYDIVDFMISIMNKDQLNQVEDMLTNQYPED